MARAQYEAAARAAAREQGIPEDLFLRLVTAESGWNPRAGSPAGAQGLTQLMPATARGLGVTNVYDPVQNLRGGAKYLRQQFDTFGRWDLALAAYNAGPNAVRRAGGIPNNAETRAYVPRVLGSTPAAAPPASSGGGLARLVGIVATALPGASSFRTPDGPEGVPAAGGRYIHGGLDWFAPGGSAAVSPVAGKVIESRASRGSSGQVFGGVVKIEADDGKVYVLRHVDPISTTAVGRKVQPGQRVATVTNWTDGNPHVHVEVWKSAAGGYTAANLLDPATVFRGAAAAPTQFGPGGVPLNPPGGIPGVTAPEDPNVAPFQPGDRTGGILDAPLELALAPVNAIKEFITGSLVTVLVFVLVGVVAVWLIGSGSSRAFGTPAPGALINRVTPGG